MKPEISPVTWTSPTSRSSARRADATSAVTEIGAREAVGRRVIDHRMRVA